MKEETIIQEIWPHQTMLNNSLTQMLTQLLWNLMINASKKYFNKEILPYFYSIPLLKNLSKPEISSTKQHLLKKGVYYSLYPNLMMVMDISKD